MSTQTAMSTAQFKKLAETGMTERDWQKQVVTFARQRDWLVYFTWNSLHSPAGYPDLTMVRSMPNGDRRIVFAELKRMKGEVTAAQREWLDVLGQVAAECGRHVEVHCWRPNQWPEVREVLT